MFAMFGVFFAGIVISLFRILQINSSYAEMLEVRTPIIYLQLT